MASQIVTGHSTLLILTGGSSEVTTFYHLMDV